MQSEERKNGQDHDDQADEIDNSVHGKVLRIPQPGCNVSPCAFVPTTACDILTNENKAHAGARGRFIARPVSGLEFDISGREGRPSTGTPGAGTARYVTLNSLFSGAIHGSYFRQLPSECLKIGMRTCSELEVRTARPLS